MATRPTSTIGLISADAHVNEPRNLWRDGLPAGFADRAMSGIVGDSDGGWDLILDGRHIAVDAESEEQRLLALQPEHRLGVMRQEGIVGECIYPTIGLYVWMLEDPEGGRLSCRIYNEWIVEQLQNKSNRFRCAGLVPTWNLDDAIAEVLWIKENGLGSCMLPAVAPKSYNDPHWEPLWAAITSTGLPVVMHQGTGHNMIWYRGPGATVGNLIATQSMAPRTATLLATSGVLERHPDLHVVFVEYNTGWLAWVMDTIDYYNHAFAGLTTETQGSAKLARRTGPPRPVIYPELPNPPSYYVRRQIHATFQDDPVGIHNVVLTGVSGLMWGSDYPHSEGTYPHSRQTVDRLSRGLPEAEAAAIFRDTAAALFDFDPSVFSTPIDA